MLYFSKEYAKYFGVEVSIVYTYVVDNFNQKPFKARHLVDVFPFWNIQKIGRILSTMVREGLLELSDYKDYPTETTRWYEEVKGDED